MGTFFIIISIALIVFICTCFFVIYIVFASPESYRDAKIVEKKVEQKIFQFDERLQTGITMDIARLEGDATRQKISEIAKKQTREDHLLNRTTEYKNK